MLVPGAGGGVLVPGDGGGVTDPGDGGGVVVDGAVVDGDVLPGGGVTVEGDGGTLGAVPLVLDGRGDVDVLVDVELALEDVVPVDVPDAVPAEAGGVVEAVPPELGVPGAVVEVEGTPGGVRVELELVLELDPVRNVPTVPRTGAAASTPVPPCWASAAALGITISTRRLLARPSGERLLATGRSGPSPCVISRSPGTPCEAR